MDAFFFERIHQLTQHQHRDSLIIRLTQRTKDDHLIDTPDEFRAEKIAECLHDLFPGGSLDILCEAHRAFLALATCIGGHDDHGIFEIDRAALCVRNASLIKNLKQNIEDVRMCLFDLVEQNDRIRLAAHLFGELARLIIADIAGRRTDDAGNAVLFHKFGHIKADECFRCIEQLVSQLLDQLCLPPARGAHKDKGSRTAAGTDLHTAAADSCRYEGYRLVLADHLGFQRFLQARQAAQVALDDFARGNASPELNDVGQVVLCDTVVICSGL